MQKHIYQDLHEISIHLAAWITDYIGETIGETGRFTWALSGGNSPKELYQLMGKSPYRERIDWSKMHIFWGDERDVPFDDPRNNAKMTFDTLLNQVPIPKDQIHIMRTDIPPEKSAEAYQNLLHNYFAKEGKSFDLTLLGMGEDGHTLSLFPGTAVIWEKNAWASSFYLPSQSMYRITLTPPIVNRSSRIVFLTCGLNKSKALQAVLEGPYLPDQFPSQVIQPDSGELHWFIDQDAASSLSQN
ncbi:MAG: 6-phosphogluconolactonase [Chitinophagaceae bacterium]